ncbi:MAG TPA: tetratricopeptide repeat protein [Planctomycetes bacterium]|nr:tetratricopeptide repeat protein [Planctomycetota bacterium]
MLKNHPHNSFQVDRLTKHIPMQMSGGKLMTCSRFHWCSVILVMGMVNGCSVNTDSPEVTLEKANIMSDRGRYNDAVLLYTKAAAGFPNRGDIYYRRGICYENLELLPRALEDYSRCLELQPSHLDSLNNRGVVLAKLERYEEASEAFAGLIRQQPDNVLALRNRGLCQHDLGNFDEALADYTAAVTLAPHDAENWFQRGNVYLQQGRLVEAEADYTRAIEINATHAKAWMNRGVGRYNAGEQELAMQHLEHARELDGNIIIPGIDWVEIVPTAAVVTAVPVIDDSIFNWETCTALARSTLSDRGYEVLSVVKDYPALRCSKLLAKKDGRNVAVFIGCETANLESVTLAAMNRTADAEVQRVLLIVRHNASIDAAYSVSRFIEGWEAETEKVRPLIITTDLPPGPPSPAP